MLLYIAEIEDLENTDPEDLAECESGNWVVNKSEDSPFCTIGNKCFLTNLFMCQFICVLCIYIFTRLYICVFVCACVGEILWV